MSVSIIKGEPYKLQIPEFVCDKPLKEGVPEPFNMLVSGFKFITIIARPGSGKTSLLISLFKDKNLMRKVYDNIVLVMPKQSLMSLKAKDNVFKKLSLEKYYENLENIDQIREQIKYYAQEGETTCLILDDVATYLKDGYVQRALSDIVLNRRHFKCSIILLTQIYNKMPLVIRKMINVAVILFRPAKKEMNDMFNELLEYNEDISHQIYNIAFKKPFDQLWIDVPNQLVYANADRILVSED